MAELGRPAAPELTVALSTLAERVHRIRLDNLPFGPRWRYLIISQHGSTSEKSADSDSFAALFSDRPDIECVSVAGHGVAASRNSALQRCRTELLLFTDDDVTLLPQGLGRLLDAFASEPDIDIIAAQTLGGDGLPAKRYPSGKRSLTAFNCARIGTVELAVRPQGVLARELAFDLNFGAGQKNFLGDEYIFVTDCIRAGLKGIYLPIPLVAHADVSSGSDFQSAAASLARAKVFERVFRFPLTPLVKLAFILRHRRKFASIGEALKFSRIFMRDHSDS